MTTQEKLHAVETAIRKTLPRLTEPTEGCRILEKGKAEENYSIILVDGDDYTIFTPYSFGLPIDKIDQEDLSENYEIIGHDILLSDVLEWLNAINELNTSVILRKEVFEFQRIEKENKLFIVGWDLSKPRLADQSEELIDLLYNLIKE